MSQFFSMGGYAQFVWPAYGISLLLLVINFIWPVWRKRAIIRQIHRLQQRQQQLAMRQSSAQP